MFRASLCPSSGAYQLHQQPLVYRRNVVVAVLLATTNNKPIINCCIYLVDSFECPLYICYMYFLPNLSYMLPCVMHHPQEKLRTLTQNCQLFT
jgi:uncharacterized membrane protein